MPEPFRLLDLPIEIQVNIFSFYFGSPFDIQICRVLIDDEHYGKIKWSNDSRSSFCALWTSPDIRSQVRTAYLAGFSGYVDLRYLSAGTIPADKCRTAIYDSVLRTVPKSRVKILDLGEQHRCHCREGDESESSDDSRKGSSCRRNFFISRQLPKLEKICLTLMQVRARHHDIVYFDEVMDGVLDSGFIKSASNQLRRRRFIYGNSLQLLRSGRAPIVEITMYDLINYVVPKQYGLPLWNNYVVSIVSPLMSSELTIIRCTSFMPEIGETSKSSVERLSMDSLARQERRSLCHLLSLVDAKYSTSDSVQTPKDGHAWGPPNTLDLSVQPEAEYLSALS